MPQRPGETAARRVRVTRVGPLKFPWVPRGRRGARSSPGEMFPEGAKAGDAAGSGRRGGPGRGSGRAGAAGGGGPALSSEGPPRCSVPAAREEETAGRAGSSGAAPPRRSPGGRQLRAPPLPPPAPRAPPAPWRGPPAPGPRCCSWPCCCCCCCPPPCQVRGVSACRPTRVPAGGVGRGGAAGRGAQGLTRSLGMPGGAALCPSPAPGRAPRRHRGGHPAEPPPPCPAEAPAAAPVSAGPSGGAPAGAEGNPSGERAPRVTRLSGSGRDPQRVSALRAAPERGAAAREDTGGQT